MSNPLYMISRRAAHWLNNSPRHDMPSGTESLANDCRTEQGNAVLGILTRPLGATAGDFRDKPISDGGGAMSRPLASAVVAVLSLAAGWFCRNGPVYIRPDKPDRRQPRRDLLRLSATGALNH